MFGKRFRTDYVPFPKVCEEISKRNMGELQNTPFFFLR